MFIPYQNTHNAANLLYMFIGPSNIPKIPQISFLLLTYFSFSPDFYARHTIQIFAQLLKY